MPLRSLLLIPLTALLVATFVSTANGGGIYPPPKGIELPQVYFDRIAVDPQSYQFKRAYLGLTRRVIANRMMLQRGLMGVAEAEEMGGTAVTGTKDIPVLTGLFANTGSAPYAVSNLQTELFDGPWASGTMSDYYQEISYGAFDVDGSVYDWVTVSQNDTYYEGSSGCCGLAPGCGARTGEFLKEVLDANDPSIDFSQYDNDGPDGVPNSGDDDGYVDFVAFVQPERGGECGTNNIWSHRWVYEGWPISGGAPYQTDDNRYGGGKILVDDYTIQPALACDNSTMIQIGVFCHEFGHAFGLPDLYDTDGGSEGLGNYCLMAGGSWGGNGVHPEKPSHMSAWCKMMLGWTQPTLVESAGTVSLGQAETNDDAAKLWEDAYQGDRYFLIENRQKVGFDQYLPLGGLLIYHVDSEVITGNTKEVHKYVDLEEADGDDDLDNEVNRGDTGDPYPGVTNNRTFDGATYPSSDDYQGVPTGVSCENISDSGATMTFDATPRELQGYTIVYDPWGNWGWGWGYSTPTDIWGAVHFTTADAGTLVAIRTAFRDDNTDYTLKIYDGGMSGGSPGALVTSQSGNFAEGGYNEITLASPQAVGPGEDFLADVKYEDKTYSVPIDGDSPPSGRSYYSEDGSSYYAIDDYNVDFRAVIRTPQPAEPGPPVPALSRPLTAVLIGIVALLALLLWRRQARRDKSVEK
jgi:M6 family metalloprotease-like protein